MVEFVVGTEDDEGNFTITEYAKLIGFLHYTKFALVEGHLKDKGNNVTRRYRDNDTNIEEEVIKVNI